MNFHFSYTKLYHCRDLEIRFGKTELNEISFPRSQWCNFKKSVNFTCNHQVAETNLIGF